MGFGTELPLLLALGFVVSRPKRMQTMLARPKTELHRESRGINSRLPGDIKATKARPWPT